MSSPNFPPTLLPLHPTPEPDLLVHNELPDHPYPAVMTRQISVELIRDLIELPKSRPRDRREVMMFIVQSDIVRKQIEDAVVRVRLRRRRTLSSCPRRRGVLAKDVVFCDEVARAWV